MQVVITGRQVGESTDTRLDTTIGDTIQRVVILRISIQEGDGTVRRSADRVGNNHMVRNRRSGALVANRVRTGHIMTVIVGSNIDAIVGALVEVVEPKVALKAGVVDVGFIATSVQSNTIVKQVDMHRHVVGITINRIENVEGTVPRSRTIVIVGIRFNSQNGIQIGSGQCGVMRNKDIHNLFCETAVNREQVIKISTRLHSVVGDIRQSVPFSLTMQTNAVDVAMNSGNRDGTIGMNSSVAIVVSGGNNPR